MLPNIRRMELKAGLWTCWLSLAILPLEVLFGAIGICPGPRDAKGAVALLGVGVFGIIVTLYSAFTVVRGIRFGGWLLRLFGALSLCSAALVGLVSWVYALEAREYLGYVLQSHH